MTVAPLREPSLCAVRCAQYPPATVSFNSQGPLLPVFGDEAPEPWRGDLPFSRSRSYGTADPGLTFETLMVPVPQILASVTILLFAVSQVLAKSASPWRIRPHPSWFRSGGGVGWGQTRSDASARVCKGFHHFKS